MNMDQSWFKEYPNPEKITLEYVDDNNSLKKMLSLIEEGKDVVEFGCATGYFSKLLIEKQCTVTGVEINPDAAEVAKQYCDQVKIADLDFISIQDIFPSQKFDVAIFGDVLEHLRNPWKILEDTKEILKEDGYVIASIPNIAHGSIRLALLEGRFEYTDLGILDNTHLRFFTRKTVKDLFERSGYLVDIVDCTKIDFLSDHDLIPKNSKFNFSLDTLKRIERDEDCNILQFIIKAYPYSPSRQYFRTRLQQTQSQLQQTQSQLQQTQSQLQQTQSQLQQTQVELQNAASIIIGMESSKFWQLRNIWFFLKEKTVLRQGAEYLYRIIIQVYLIYKIPKIWKERGTQGLISFLYSKITNKVEDQTSYQNWIARNEPQPDDVLQLVKEIEDFKYSPKFSVIIPVYNVDKNWLKKAIDSVCNQIYKNWEICLVDDASTKDHIKPLLTQYSQKDSRIKVVFREENGNISAASNSALDIATGDYIALLDHDDELAINALFENAKLINDHPDADFIYSDEDKIDLTGKRCDPFFKPDWSPDYFHSCMYTCHLGVYRTSLIREIGGFRSEYDGSQDYDLVLRVGEKTKNIYHIPKILYHKKIHSSSDTSGAQAKPWTYNSAKKGLEDMLRRSSYTGDVQEVSRGIWRVRRDIVGQPLVSIIIPSAGKMCDSNRSHLERCVASVQSLSQYRNFEVVIVDGYDIKDEILKRISAPNIKVVRCTEEFNYSMRINRGVEATEGDLLLLLNDDTEVISHDWLECMIEFAQQPEVGAVGAKLFFPNGNLQHTGVILLDAHKTDKFIRPVHCFSNQLGNHPGYFCSNIVNRNYIAVTAACLMVRKLVFQEVGGMDEDFPLNYNDVDFCLKLHQVGYRNVFTPYTQLMHYESATRKAEVKVEEIKRLNDKWKVYLESLGGDPYYNVNLSTDSCDFKIPI